VEAWLIFPLYLLTFAAAAIALAKTLAAPDLASALVPLTVTAMAFGALICMVAPCILATYYPRFSVPVIPLFVICAGYVMEGLLPKTGQAHRSTQESRLPHERVSDRLTEAQ